MIEDPVDYQSIMMNPLPLMEIIDSSPKDNQ